MQFNIPQQSLAHALAWALNAVSSRPPSPALSGVRVEAVEGVVRLTGFDYESMASVTATADVDTPGTVVTPGRATLDIVKGLPKTATVNIEVVDGDRLRITAGRSKYEVPLIPADQYPKVPDLPPAVGTVDGGSFGEAVKRVAVAASKDDTLPILAALHITTGDGHLTMEATDRYRVHTEDVPATVEGGRSWLVRADRLTGRIPANGDVTILADGATFGVRTGSRAFTTQVTDGEYPKIARLWPENPTTGVEFDRDDMVRAVTAISSVVERNLPVILDITDGEITLEAGAEQYTGTEVVPCQANDPVRVAYNPHYLRDALATVTPGPVTLHLTHPGKPVTITGDTTARALLMPVRLPETK